MKNERLFCLDALRGLDMLLLTVIGPLLWAIHAFAPLPVALQRQLQHAWGGFTLWDIIMPLFIFMCGAAIPFGLGKRLVNGRATWAYWKHVALRFAMLWILGMMAQGRLFTYDPLMISPFNNTLQTIAIGYVIAAAAFLIPNVRVRRLVPVALALFYAILLHFGGDYSQTGNVAIRFENWFVTLIMPAGTKAVELADPGYTWWCTIPMFGAMTLCGMEATLLLRGEGSQLSKFARLSILGAALLAFGWAITPWVPMIKHIYTLSFTAQAMGWSCLALALLYCLTDILQWRRGWWLVTLFGQTALLAYMCIEVFGATFNAFASQVTWGIGHVIGPQNVEAYAPIVRWFVASGLLVAVLAVRRAAKAGKK